MSVPSSHKTAHLGTETLFRDPLITALFIPRIGDVLMLTLSLHIFMNITCSRIKGHVNI